MSQQDQPQGGDFFGGFAEEMQKMTPEAAMVAKMMQGVDIIGRVSNRRGIYMHHLLKGTRVWGGTFWQDFWINFCNAHPAFGIFLSHPKHPLSSKERFIILTFELLLKLFVAGMFALAEPDGDNQEIVNMVESVIVALLTTVFNAGLVFIATCDDKVFGDSVGGIFRLALSSLSACGLCCAWFFMLVLGSVGVVLVATGENSDFGDYMVVTAQSLGWSWFVIWPLVNGLLLFGFGRWREQRRLAEEGIETEDGIDRETLIWWENNEFEADKNVVVGNGFAIDEAAVPGAIATALDGSGVSEEDAEGGARVSVEDAEGGARVSVEDAEGGARVSVEDAEGGARVSVEDAEGGTRVSVEDAEGGARVAVEDAEATVVSDSQPNTSTDEKPSEGADTGAVVPTAASIASDDTSPPPEAGAEQV